MDTNTTPTTIVVIVDKSRSGTALEEAKIATSAIESAPRTPPSTATLPHLSGILLPIRLKIRNVGYTATARAIMVAIYATRMSVTA